MMNSKSPDRRTFIKQSFLLTSALFGVSRSDGAAPKNRIMTVTGMIDPSAMKQTLVHEHILVDFIGAEEVNPPRWDRDAVMQKVLPYLQEVKSAGCNTLVDCTPNYLGRDVALLKQLSERVGLYILTNTGYYGGSDHKFLPPNAFTESAEQLSDRWLREWHHGIDGTPVRPGFMKISVNPSHLSDVSLKLITAAALTHLKSGLTIASHTGPAQPAFQQIEVLKLHRVDPSAFIWVHAQNEADHSEYVRAVHEGAWVSLDGLREENVADYVTRLTRLKKDKCLHRVLVSHDAGWYDPAKPDGGEFRPFTTLFRKLIPALEQEGFAETDILQLIQLNPANALVIGVKKLRRKRK